MNADRLEQERAAFDKWSIKFGPGFRTYTELNSIELAAAWKAWQARAQQQAAPEGEQEFQTLNAVLSWSAEDWSELLTRHAQQREILQKLLGQQQAASGVPGGLNALQERWLMDAGRDAYDCGYNDARDACAKPGDGAPGYRGREIERKTRDNFSRVIAQAATPTAPAQRASAVPDGFKLVAVKGFDELVEALARAARKIYLPDAMADEWAALDWHTVATPTAPADVMADAEKAEARATIFRLLADVAEAFIEAVNSTRGAESGHNMVFFAQGKQNEAEALLRKAIDAARAAEKGTT